MSPFAEAYPEDLAENCKPSSSIPTPPFVHPLNKHYNMLIRYIYHMARLLPLYCDSIRAGLRVSSQSLPNLRM